MTFHNLPIHSAQARKFIKNLLASVCLNPEQAALEARVLLEFVTGQTLVELLTQSDPMMTTLQWQQLQALLHARITDRQPIQYLTEEAWFYGLKLKVSPAVLIPRPETERLVDAILYGITRLNRPASEAIRLLDLGTGSGAIVIAVAQHTTAKIEITATDISPEALQIARENIELHQVAQQITLVHSNWYGALAPTERFDMIVSNPPYIALPLAREMQPEVTRHEPHLALFAKNNGLAAYQEIARLAHQFLTPQGQIFLEFGVNQAEPLRALFAPYFEVDIQTDLSGIPRVLSGKLKD